MYAYSVAGSPESLCLARDDEEGASFLVRGVPIRLSMVDDDKGAEALLAEPASIVEEGHDDAAVIREALQHFAEAERHERGWSSPDFVLAAPQIDAIAEAFAGSGKPPSQKVVESTLASVLSRAKLEKYGTQIAQVVTRHDATTAVPLPPPPTPVLTPVCDTAKRWLDAYHRRAIVETHPVAAAPKLRVVHAPAGGGKSSLLLDIVERWPEIRFLFVAFSRDLCTEMRQRLATSRAEPLRNADVVTLDAFCKRRRGVDGIEFITGNLSDARVVRAVQPGNRYGRAKGSHGIGAVVSYALNSTVPPGRAVPLCDKHAPMQRAFHAAMHGTTTGLRNSFCGCRYEEFVATRRPQDAVVAPPPCDVVLVDEVQDLTSQAVEILLALGKPVVAVGDPLQQIYGFGNDQVCSECKAAVDAASLAPRFETDVLDHDGGATRLYTTFRLSGETVAHLERLQPDHFQATSAAAAPATDHQSGIVLGAEAMPPHYLRLCRTNAEVVAAARADPTLRVVAGETIANEIEAADAGLGGDGKRRHRLTAMQRIAIDARDAEGGVETVVGLLRERHIELSQAARGNRAVASVHRAKGYEAENVVVGSDLYDSFAHGTELCVGFVALSRHRHRLLVVREEAARPKKKRRVAARRIK